MSSGFAPIPTIVMVMKSLIWGGLAVLKGMTTEKSVAGAVYRFCPPNWLAGKKFRNPAAKVSDSVKNTPVATSAVGNICTSKVIGATP